ncbi:MAG TPA: ComF family protein [Thermoanaerobaculia bacterium]
MSSRLAGALSVVGREALRIVLPSPCVACGRELPWRDRTASCCGECWAKLPKILTTKCTSCARPYEGLHCVPCALDPLPLEWCETFGLYEGPLVPMVTALKYRRHDFLDEALAGLMEEALRARGDLAFDALVPVPMARTKERRRGYNQATLLALALSRRIGVPCDMTLLARGAERSTQASLRKKDRAANVLGAFTASDGAHAKQILIVDDISTTGETFRACARALHGSGAARVCAVSVAKAI